MKFTPLKFQSTLAAAGITLMAYVFLKANVLQSDGGIGLADIAKLPAGSMVHGMAWGLTGLMALFIVIHFSLTAIFLKELMVWFATTGDFKELLKNPLTNSALFSPLISLPMSMIVFFGPVSFFLPQLSANMDRLILPAFIIFSLLWSVLVVLEVSVGLVLWKQPLAYTKLGFGWLLDVMALGAVSLLGSSIANISGNTFIAQSSAFMSTITVFIGLLLFTAKAITLLQTQLRTKTMPGPDLLPAYFLAVPPTCLLWLSFYKLLTYTDKSFGVDTSLASAIVIISSYLAAIGWFIFAIILLRKYLAQKFLTTDFAHAQWGMV